MSVKRLLFNIITDIVVKDETADIALGYIVAGAVNDNRDDHRKDNGRRSAS